MYIFKAGIIGAGAMGAGIAQVITYSGLPVVLKDANQQLADKGAARVRAIYQSRVDRGKMDPGQMDEKMALLIPTASYDDFRDVDIVIEAVPEKMELKKHIFADIEAVCPEGTIFASNTSALSISALAAATARPRKVIGMHFFNPAHVMKLVEVIPGLDTSQETVDDIVMFAESLRKIPVVVQECAGFLVNRILMPFLNESVYALQEGAATATEMDRVVVASGMPMGPFTLADFLGLDVCSDVAGTLYEEYGERMRPAELLGMIVAAGRLGEKSGAGFYGYGGNDDEPVKAMIKSVQQQSGIAGTPFSLNRLFLPMVNEAILCLQENIASVGDINKAMIAGAGMKRGTEIAGPLQIADAMGLDVVLDEMLQLEKALGQRFHPAPLLRRKVLAGHLGKKTGKGFSEYTT
jgi:3-hydroxyacyl-CoA dehydrogenase / enoyl-CoA hydratase / 3-hydroxybutyryl-CoA epimerase